VTKFHALCKNILSNEGVKDHKNCYLPLLTLLTWKRLQIDTDFLPITTSTADDFPGVLISIILNELKPHNGGFSQLFAIFGPDTHF